MTHNNNRSRISVAGWLTTAILGALATFAIPAQALTTGTWELHNHPDGNVAQPLYGLRLDNLLGDGIYTFDFDAADQGAAMFMDISNTSIAIYGSAWGGLDIGNSYSSPALWDIYMTYDIAGSSADGGVNDLHADSGNGMITLTGDELTFNLIAYSGMFDHAFYLGDEDGSGHRGYDGVSGWGWVNYYLDGGDPDVHVASSDFLFTASPVPVPPALWLFGSSVFSFLIVRRRRE